MEHEFKASDFNGLFLKVYGISTEKDLLNVFPILESYDEFKTIHEDNRNKIIKYIVFAFDRNTPLNTITDVIERRVEAALLAGFKPENKKFSVNTDKMLRSINPVINSAIIRYCILQGEEDWTMLVTFQEALRQQLEKMFLPDDDDDISKIIKNVKELRTQITLLRQSILSQNTDYFLTRSLYDFSEAERLELSPETYAERLAEWDNISSYYKKLNTLTHNESRRNGS